MKNRLLWLSVLLLLVLSCRQQNAVTGRFQLLPHPQQFDITGAGSLQPNQIKQVFLADGATLPVAGQWMSRLQLTPNQAQAHIAGRIDTTLDTPKEGYRLSISHKKIIIDAKDQAGLLYAFMTLEQLMEDAQEQKVTLPLCSITDYPLLAYRAIHLDLKHHLETTEYYYQMMDRLARYKINAIIAEVEDKMGYRRRPKVASADALSMDDWKKLSDYARQRNIEISPLVQGLGHASFILKHEEYKNLRDDPKSDWAFNPLDPKTYEVQFDLYHDALEAMPHGRYLHVGGDEVLTTGRGSGKSALELQLIWLEKVCRYAAEQGRTPIFWDDMPLKQANVYRPIYDTRLSKASVDSIWQANEHILLQFLDRFPKNCIYMRWNYSTPETPGNSKAVQWFRDHDLQVMGATAGQTRWVLMPQEESNMNNIRSFALSSIENGANGLLLTLWDDDSPHFELYWRGIIAFAEYTWSGEKRNKTALKSAYRHREYGSALADTSKAFIDQLETPVAFWKNALLKKSNRNHLKTLPNPSEDAIITLPDPDHKGAWSYENDEKLKQAEKMLAICDTVSRLIEETKLAAIRNTFTLEVYEQVNHMARFAPEMLLALRAYDKASKEEEPAALATIQDLNKRFVDLRKELEAVYGKTRRLRKPDGYILDQDHHEHLANQSVGFDWLFYVEQLLLEKLDKKY